MSRNIDIKISNLKTIISGEPVIVCNNSDYIITFEFDEDWEAYDVKTARFVYTRDSHIQLQDIVFTGNICQVPVFYDITDVFVGVFAGDIHTTTPAKIFCVKSILDYDGPPEEPSPDVYAQIMELINSGKLQGPAGEAGATYTPAVSDDGELSWTNDRGLDNPKPVNIRGPQGKEGSPGPQGPPGDNTAALEAAQVANEAAANANAAADAAGELAPEVEQLKGDLDYISVKHEITNYGRDLTGNNVTVFAVNNSTLSFERDTGYVSAICSADSNNGFAIRIDNIPNAKDNAYDVSFRIESGTLLGSPKVCGDASESSPGYYGVKATIEDGVYFVKNFKTPSDCTNICIYLITRYDNHAKGTPVKVTSVNVSLSNAVEYRTLKYSAFPSDTKETIDNLSEYISEIDTKNSIVFKIPSNVDFVIGMENYMYFDGFVYSANEDWQSGKKVWQVSDIQNHGTYSEIYDDRHQIICVNPSEPANFYNRIYYRKIDANGNYTGDIISSDDFKCNFINPITNPTSKKNILVVGDSYTSYSPNLSRIWLAWMNDNHFKDLSNINFFGSQYSPIIGGYTTVPFEAHGGYTWQNYVNDPSTLPIGFNRNPFWINGKLDVKAYVDQYAGTGENLDYIIFQIGINSFVNSYFQTDYDSDIDKAMNGIKTLAEQLINHIHGSYPACKMLLVGYPYTPHRANAPEKALWFFNKAVSAINSVYHSLEMEYTSYVRFVQTSAMCNYKTFHGKETVNVDAYNTKELNASDYVHPCTNGSKQFGDAIYRGLCGLFEM